MSQNSSKTMWISVAAIIVIAIVGMFFIVQANNGNTIDPNDLNLSLSTEDIDVSEEWVKGDPNAEFLIVEYSDFQCPACASRYKTLDKIVKEFNGKVALVYRHYPLAQHFNSKVSAYAAEAAGMQGMFFEMHDIIFDNQAVWQGVDEGSAKDMFVQYAEEIGVPDLDKFEEDMNSGEVEKAVEADYASGVALGINSTPTVFFDGELATNSHDYDAFRLFIRDAIDAADTN